MESPILLVDVDGYWQPLVALIDHVIAEGFADASLKAALSGGAGYARRWKRHCRPGPRGMREGGCGCGQVRYRMEGAPLVVHCCHCRWCQRETGSAFALNAMIEADRVVVLAGAPA
jgi:hypothetical protein